MHTIELKAVLQDLGKQPNKRLGQNFLIDQSVIHAAIEAGEVGANDLVLEVGPGLGVLTEALLEKGAYVIAIEKDKIFTDRLQSLHPESNSLLRVISGDASVLDWDSIFNPTSHVLRPTSSYSWKFISNIPYNITSLLLRKALWSSNPPTKGIVLIQKEVAERCMGCFKKNGDRSLLSLMIGLSCSSARIVRSVPPQCFFPPPKVDSALFEFIPMSIQERQKKWGIDPEEVMKIAKVAFAHPRKQMASNLGHGGWGMGDGLKKADIERVLISLSLNPKIRSEELSIQDWVALAKRLSE